MSGIFLNWVDRLARLGLEVVLGRYYGEYDGICKDNADPSGRGRIKVMVPATGILDVPLSCWASPIFSTGAGVGYGSFWPPEVGDHVMVSFDMGDMAKPVYKGGSFKVGGVPAEFAPEVGKAPMKRGWKSKAGHWLRFDDTPGGEKVTIGSKGKSFVNLDDGVFIAANGGNSVFQMKDGTIVLVDAVGNVLSTSSDGWTIQNGTVFIQLKGDMIQMVGAKIAICGSTSIGAPQADSPAVRWTELSSWLATHAHDTFHGPSGPPLQAALVSSFKSKSVMIS
jgi:hypothetical protein